jgi:hypothetical protein
VDIVQDEPVVIGLMPHSLTPAWPAIVSVWRRRRISSRRARRFDSDPPTLGLRRNVRTTADISLRGSVLAGRTWENCADICESCARECARFPDDARLQVCVESCRGAATSCRVMADLQRNHPTPA